MAVYRKKLFDKDGNTIIPAIGDIYGSVYTASLSSASGGIATYTFTPDTPVENNRVYAVKFPAPTVNNATIILGDGVSSGSILVPPVAATDSPNYESLTTDMINDTEPLLLMYNGVQWVCLNQKKTVSTADLDDGAVKSAKIDFTTFGDWHNVRLINGAGVVNTNYTHQNNRWRYTEGGRLIAIEFNVGFDAYVNAGTNSTPCWNRDDVPFITNGKFMRLVGTGVGSNIVELVFDINSTIYFRPVTGASNYCAGEIVIPNPTFVE